MSSYYPPLKERLPSSRRLFDFLENDRSPTLLNQHLAVAENADLVDEAEPRIRAKYDPLAVKIHRQYRDQSSMVGTDPNSSKDTSPLGI